MPTSIQVGALTLLTAIQYGFQTQRPESPHRPTRKSLRQNPSLYQKREDGPNGQDSTAPAHQGKQAFQHAYMHVENHSFSNKDTSSSN